MLSLFTRSHRPLIICGALSVLVAVIAWSFRDQIYQTIQDPGVPFQTYSPPPAADYANDTAWFSATGFAHETQPAVFFVHGTTYSGGANWNAQLDKARANDATVSVVLPNYAAPFAVTGALYAPRYRQAALYAYMNNREDGQLARMFAFADIERAFAAFLERAGPDRPLILAGVGQGGLHLLGLLVSRVAADASLVDRLVAAYVLEAPVPLDLFEQALSDLPVCETAQDVRCVYSYSIAYPGETARLRQMTERQMSWTAAGTLAFVEGRTLACVNPLIGGNSAEIAPERLHRGGVAAAGFGPDVAPAPIPAQTGAQCVEGVLQVDRPRSRVLRRPARLAEDFREPPFNLFYEDLRLDAARRSLNLATIRGEEGRWAPALGGPEEIDDAPVQPIPDRREF